MEMYKKILSTIKRKTFLYRYHAALTLSLSPAMWSHGTYSQWLTHAGDQNMAFIHTRTCIAGGVFPTVFQTVHPKHKIPFHLSSEGSNISIKYNKPRVLNVKLYRNRSHTPGSSLVLCCSTMPDHCDAKSCCLGSWGGPARHGCGRPRSTVAFWRRIKVKMADCHSNDSRLNLKTDNLSKSRRWYDGHPTFKSRCCPSSRRQFTFCHT